MTAKPKRPQMREQIEDLKAENAMLRRKLDFLEEELRFERLQQQRMAQQRASANGNGLHR